MPRYPGIKLAAAAFAALAMVSFSKCTNEWQNEMAMDPNGDFYMFWNLSNENITIEIQVRTKGYVALGFSPHGGMKGADIVTAWMKESQVFIQDRHATGNVEPIIDDTQDYEMIAGIENDTHTVLRFTRQLETCDQQDLPILNKVTHIIYAWSNDDPVSGTNIEYHGAENRGTKAVNPTASKVADSQITDDVYAWDLPIPKVTIPPYNTVYLCHYIKVPETGVKKHLVGMNVTVPPGYEYLVHHVIITQCTDKPSDEYESKLNGSGFACVTDVGCFTMLFGIHLEGQTTKVDLLPEHLGIPFGKTDRPTYFAVSIHYDNPEYRKDIIDEANIRLMITDKLRQYDAGVLTVASIPLMVIPPQQENFTISSICPSQCTKKMLPEVGINIYGVLLHGHSATRKIYIRHFRDGIELPLIAYDTHYDSKFQFRANLLKDVKVLPGDILAAECEYNTMDRTHVTWGGTGSRDEMCVGFLCHYPLANVFVSLTIETIQKVVQILKTAESKQMSNNTSNGWQVPQTEYANNSDLSYIQAHGKLKGFCAGRDNKIETFEEEYPINATTYISSQLTNCQSSRDGMRKNFNEIE